MAISWTTSPLRGPVAMSLAKFRRSELSITTITQHHLSCLFAAYWLHVFALRFGYARVSLICLHDINAKALRRFQPWRWYGVCWQWFWLPQIISKPSWWFVSSWVSTIQAYISMTLTQYLKRSCLGLAESTFYPAIQYVIGSWYKGEELAKRACIFHVSSLSMS